MTVTPATPNDLPQLLILINSAYRGDVSKKGWTTEADLIGGEIRTDGLALEELINSDGAAFLKCINEKGNIEGCVYLHKKEDRLYLGMLSVSPSLQSRGTGKMLMAAAENHAKQFGCRAIFMRVISVRKELISWYEKLGYRKTGEREPFPDDNRYGTPTQPLEFLIMEKGI